MYKNITCTSVQCWQRASAFGKCTVYNGQGDNIVGYSTPTASETMETGQGFAHWFKDILVVNFSKSIKAFLFEVLNAWELIVNHTVEQAFLPMSLDSDVIMLQEEEEDVINYLQT